MSTELNCPARNISLILECLADAGSSLEKETNLKISRSSFNKLNLGKISIKNFGSDNDFVVKFKRDELNDPEFIENLQRKLSAICFN